MAGIEVELSEDGMQALVRIPSEDAADPSRPERLRAALRDAGVSNGIDEDLLHRLESAIREPCFFIEKVIARGREARPGLPGVLITAFAPFLAVGVTDDYDRVDFHQRKLLIQGRKGEILARRYAPRPGSPGRDVRDRVVEAETVGEHRTVLGPGVEIDEEGFVRARRAGVVHHRPGEQLDVIELYEHRGDVGPESGNLTSGGSLVVYGDILAGFRVAVGGDLVVQGNVDQGTFRAGGNVEVTQAIIGEPKELNRCGVDLCCKRVQGGVLQIVGSFLFDREVINAELRARRVDCSSPRGRLLGSGVIATESIRIPNVGTDAGSSVRLEVGADWRLEERIRRLEATTASRGRSRRSGSDARARTGRRKGKVGDEARRLRIELRRRNARLLENAIIEVPGTIHAGTTLVFGGVEETLEENETRVRFRLDAETGLIAREAMKR